MAWMVVVHGRGRDPVGEVKKAGFNCYRPKFMKKTKTGKRVSSFLFGRYFFVEICEKWNRLFRVKGVAGILTTALNNPAPVVDSLIEDLKSRENRLGLVVLPEKKRFRKGDRLKLEYGPFSGNIVEYLGMGRHDTERVMLFMMGRYNRIQVAAGSLVPV